VARIESPRSKSTRRRGISQAATLASIALVTACAVTTVAFVPRLVSGSGAAEAVVDHEAPSHRRVADALVAVIAGSREVLSIGVPGPDGRQEVVLWVPEDLRETIIQPGDLVVLFFSPTLEVVTAHTMEPAQRNLGGVVDPLAVRTADFAARFRALPGVERRVIATGVRSMRTSVLSDNGADLRTLRLELTFSPESADGEGVVSRVLAGIRMRR